MKILILIPSLSMGGAERVAVTLSNYWSENGHEVTIYTLLKDYSVFYSVSPLVKIEHLSYGKESSSFFSAIFQNIKIIKKLRILMKVSSPDIAIGFMTASNVYLSLARIGLSINCMGSEHIHPPMMKIGMIWDILRKFSYRNLDVVFTLSEKSATWLRTHTWAKKLVVLPNPMSYPLPSQQPFLETGRWMPAERSACLAVGRLTPQKGFDILIRAFSLLALEFLEWDLIIVGEGEDRENLELLVNELQLSGRVFLVGRAGNVSDFYRRAELYVMSSRFEGFGNTLAEALTYGLPAISFDCDVGPSDIIDHDRNGLLINEISPIGLASGMKELMLDKPRRKRFSRKAIEARSKYAVAAVAAGWEAHFVI
jgi:glycosyltransferase involved in cell wall biosynthesis